MVSDYERMVVSRGSEVDVVGAIGIGVVIVDVAINKVEIVEMMGNNGVDVVGTETPTCVGFEELEGRTFIVIGVAKDEREGSRSILT